ncbi:MAG: AraC-like DNA-binding protein [bacterium]|jgi:AraC-like DNA-binding protein
MKDIISSIVDISQVTDELPFSVYSSVYEQKILNVPVSKPLLIVVINGDKHLGQQREVVCRAGQFIFLSDSPAVHMRNIPIDNSYYALLIEFDYEDFADLPAHEAKSAEYILGDTTASLQQCLQQFIDCCAWAPEAILALRRKEILLLLYHLGYVGVISMMGKPKLSHKIHDLFHERNFQELSLDSICDHFAMSESTLRRKLKSEDTSLKALKDNARLGFSLHLLQTTSHPIGLIAEKCGYSSQSRFTERFKTHFGLTPSSLRKTKLEE